MPVVALAGVGVLAEAITALLIVLCVVLVVWLIAKFGGYIPFVGAWIVSNASAFYTWSVQQLAGAYQGMIWPLFDAVNAVTLGVTYPLNKILDFTNVVVTAMYYLRNVAIPNALNLAYHYANVVLTAAYNYTLTLYYQAIAYANVVLSAAYAYALGLYYSAIDYAYRGVSAAQSYALALYWQAYNYAATVYSILLTYITNSVLQLVGEIGALRTWTLGLVGAVANGIEADLVRLEQRLTAFLQAYVAAAEKDIITIVDGAAVIALQDVWPNLVTDVDALLDVIPDALIDIRDEIAAIPRALPLDLVGALSALGALALPLLRYLKECGVPMCADLHGLMDLLGDLASVATDVALLEFVIEAVRDPHAAAHDMSTVVGPVVRDAESLIKSLIGV